MGEEMSTQPQLDFMALLSKKAASIEVGRKLKQRGQERAAAKHSKALKIAREMAKYLAVLWDGIRPLTIEGVREIYEITEGTWDLGNAAGSVFKGPDWECVGYREATRPEAHARILRVWRLKR